MSRCDYFLTELIPNSETIYRVDAQAAADTFVCLLTELKVVVQENKAIVSVLENCKFLPSGLSSINSSSTVVLHKPIELFDPIVVELKNLLDSSFFPSQKFLRDDVLVVLRSLGFLLCRPCLVLPSSF